MRLWGCLCLLLIFISCSTAISCDEVPEWRRNCTYDCSTLEATCVASSNVTCTGDRTFTMPFNITYGSVCDFQTPESTKSYRLALVLSAFFGWSGIDRLYLGYPAIALLKFMTFGFSGLFWLFDFILIASQRVHPAGDVAWGVPDFLPRIERYTRW